jgi:endonuclease YncB( thermonuclease family)
VAPRTYLMSGQASRESLTELVYGRDVHVHVMTSAERGVLGCRVFVKGEDVGRAQLRRGMAWQSREITVDAQLLYAENHAKARRLGLWSEPEFAAPSQ